MAGAGGGGMCVRGVWLDLDKSRESDLDIQCNCIGIQVHPKLPKSPVMTVHMETFWLL